MPDLSEHDVDRIADALSQKLQSTQGGAFWIEPERHYLDHMEWQRFKEHEEFDPETRQALKDMAAAFRAGQSQFWRWFIRLVVIGAILLAGYSFFGRHP